MDEIFIVKMGEYLNGIAREFSAHLIIDTYCCFKPQIDGA